MSSKCFPAREAIEKMKTPKRKLEKTAANRTRLSFTLYMPASGKMNGRTPGMNLLKQRMNQAPFLKGSSALSL